MVIMAVVVAICLLSSTVTCYPSFRASNFDNSQLNLHSRHETLCIRTYSDLELPHNVARMSKCNIQERKRADNTSRLPSTMVRFIFVAMLLLVELPVAAYPRFPSYPMLHRISPNCNYSDRIPLPSKPAGPYCHLSCFLALYSGAQPFTQIRSLLFQDTAYPRNVYQSCLSFLLLRIINPLVMVVFMFILP